MKYESISVVGLGYVGLPTAAVFASRRVNVVGLDVNQTAVNTINRGEIHIVEPTLDIVVRAAVSQGYLRATTKAEPAQAFMIAVPTPFQGDKVPDLSYIESAAQMIAPVIQRGNLVVLESTSPVGTTEKLCAWLAKARPDLSFPHVAGEDSDIRVAHCPERVLPGQVIRELVENDRVIGGITPRCSAAALELYKTIVQGDCVLTNARTAELAKLTENSFRDVNIAFANELSLICDQLDVNVWELIQLANRHPRVNILQPGAGVGGHCIAVDPWFIVDSCPDEARMVRLSREINDHKPLWVVSKVREALDKIHAEEPARSRDDIRVACLGLAFKPNIDDLRESPAVQIAAEVTALGCQVMAVEPHIQELPPKLVDLGLQLVSLDDALEQADVLCVLVKHSAFVAATEQLTLADRLVDVVGLTRL